MLELKDKLPVSAGTGGGRRDCRSRSCRRAAPAKWRARWSALGFTRAQAEAAAAKVVAERATRARSRR